MKESVVKIEEKNYPYLLRQIHNPPSKLYVYGNKIDFNQKMVTVIGTRMPSEKGKREAIKIIKQLVNKGYCIVTSISQGLSEVICKTTLANNGKVIVIAPWDIKKMRNKKYKERIKYVLENNGNIITEYGQFDKILPKNYVEVHRILCGLSRSMIIIEAGMTSGTMITAKYGLEENREIFAVIGDLKSTKKVGTNFLIKQGAKPIISAVL